MKKLVIFFTIFLMFVGSLHVNNLKAAVNIILIKDFHSKINVIYVDSEEILVGTNEGLYYSLDLGKTFLQKNEGLNGHLEITDIKKFETKYYIGTNGGGLFSGNLKDKSWMSENSKVDCPTISKIGIYGNNIYIASHCTGFYASFDSGNSFSLINSGLSSIETTAILKGGENEYYLGTEDGLYFSNKLDKSTVWKKVIQNCKVTSIEAIKGNIFVGTNIGLYKGKYSTFSKYEVVGGNPYIYFIESSDERLLVGVKSFGIYATLDGNNFYQIKNDLILESSASKLSAIQKSFYIGDTQGKLYKIDLSKPLLLLDQKIVIGEIAKGKKYQGSININNFGFNSFSGSISGPTIINFSNKTFTGSTNIIFTINTESLSIQNYSIPITIKADSVEEKIYINFKVVEDNKITIKLKIGSYDAYVNGKLTKLDAQPFIDKTSSRTLVPIRFISEAFGATVLWDGNTKKVTIISSDNKDKIELWIGSRDTLVNGKKVEVDVAPVIIPPGRTFVPIRFISEAFGATVFWDGSTKEITIIF